MCTSAAADVTDVIGCVADAVAIGVVTGVVGVVVTRSTPVPMVIAIVIVGIVISITKKIVLIEGIVVRRIEVNANFAVRDVVAAEHIVVTRITQANAVVSVVRDSVADELVVVRI